MSRRIKGFNHPRGSDLCCIHTLPPKVTQSPSSMFSNVIVDPGMEDTTVIVVVEGRSVVKIVNLAPGSNNE